jgi:hypothetical protein
MDAIICRRFAVTLHRKGRARRGAIHVGLASGWGKQRETKMAVGPSRAAQKH